MTILIIATILIAIPFIAALFMSNDYVIEKEIVINKPKDEVLIILNYSGTAFILISAQ